MPTISSLRPLRARFAASLGLLAVASALLAPVSMLAEEVRTGKLGGLCSVGKALTPGIDDASSLPSHCELCGSAGLGLPASHSVEAFPETATAMAFVFRDAVRPASSPGLPFSRGPPAL